MRNMFCKLKTIVVFLRLTSDIIGSRNFGRKININFDEISTLANKGT